MKYFIIAGERSGDLHASNLLKELADLDNSFEALGFGGDLMASQGAKILAHYREMAFMGFWEVFKNLKTINKFLNRCKKEILSFNPDVVILVDYGGFNMKIAKFCRENKIKVFYYITPKVWAWNQKRALKLKATVDRMFVILPFERGFFRRFDWEVTYVGNPVLDAVKSYKPHVSDQIPENCIALLPGSRKQEVLAGLPVMKSVAEKHPDEQFAVAQVDNLEPGFYNSINKLPNLTLWKGHSYDLLAVAKAAIVTSGTATLETALWKVPQVVIYKTSWLSYQVAKRLVKVPYISLVNLVAGKEVVKELIQSGFTAKEVDKELNKLLSNQTYRQTMLASYDQIISLLDEGKASANAAKLMYKYLQA